MEASCHCKALRLKTEKDPFWVGACYCIDCRKVSGAPYIVWAGYEMDGVKIYHGMPKTYSSSEKVTRSFCGDCGSPFSYQYNSKPEKIFIPIGIFDDAENFKLEKHIWVSQKLPWVHITDDLLQSD